MYNQSEMTSCIYERSSAAFHRSNVALPLPSLLADPGVRLDRGLHQHLDHAGARSHQRSLISSSRAGQDLFDHDRRADALRCPTEPQADALLRPS